MMKLGIANIIAGYDAGVGGYGGGIDIALAVGFCAILFILLIIERITCQW